MPLSAPEFQSYVERLSLSAAAISYIADTRSSEPARSVRSVGYHNTVWRYPSAKMGFSVALESTEEHTCAAQLEYDASVIEYWDQPPAVSLDVLDFHGRRRKANYVADFLTLKESSVEVVQVKTASECERLASSNPNRWTWDGAKAADLAADAHFQEIGLVHRVVSDGCSRRIFAENCLLLLRLRQASTRSIDARQLAKACSTLRQRKVFTLGQLMRAVNTSSANEVVRLIDLGALFTDLNRCRLSVPDECLVSFEPDIVTSHLHRLDMLGTAAEHLFQLTQAEAIEVHGRLLVIRGLVPAMKSDRTTRRWRARFLQAGGDPSALRPRHRSKGNRTPRQTPEEFAVMDRAISTYFLSADALSVQAAYSQYLLDHQLSIAEGKLLGNSVAASKETFRLRCKRLPKEIAEGARSGTRAAAASAPPVDPALTHLSPARAFERAHTDHYQCDLHVVVIDTKPPITSKPWITVLRDHATGQVLATSLSFSSPSNHSVLGVLRDCARRWGRLPESIVVDNGAEFNSVYFETTLASLGVSKQSRPPGEPRSGGQIEGWFRSLKSYLSQQPGNTTNDARGRSATAKFKGQSQTSWTLATAYQTMDEFIFSIYNNNISDGCLHSRSHASESLLTAFPESGVPTPFTRELLARTAIPLRRPLRLDRARGIRHCARWYRHPKLFESRSGPGPFEAYVEPWDANTLYVLIDGQRIPCRHGSQHAIDLTTDFTPALDSIRFLGSTRGRALLAKAASIETAKLTRRFAEADKARQRAISVSKAQKPAAPRKRLPARRALILPYGPGDAS